MQLEVNTTGRLPGARPCPGSGRRPKQDARPPCSFGLCPKLRRQRLPGFSEGCQNKTLNLPVFFGRCSEKNDRPARPGGRVPQESRVGAHPALSVVLRLR